MQIEEEDDEEPITPLPAAVDGFVFSQPAMSKQMVSYPSAIGNMSKESNAKQTRPHSTRINLGKLLQATARQSMPLMIVTTALCLV